MEAEQHTANNQQITEEIKKEIKICIEMNENENINAESPGPRAWALHQERLLR